MRPLDGLQVLFAGSGAFGAPTLRRLVQSGAAIAQVYTQPAKPAGRGKKLTSTPIASVAREYGLPLTETADINALSLPPADALIVIAFGQKLLPATVDHARLGAINLHASRLPAYRGAAPIHWAVINGDATTGNSVIRLAQKMDAGAVLAMSETPIGETRNDWRTSRSAVIGWRAARRASVDCPSRRHCQTDRTGSHPRDEGDQALPRGSDH